MVNKNLEELAFVLYSEIFKKYNVSNTIIGEYLTPKRGKNLLKKDAVWGDIPVVAGGLEPSTYHNQSNTTAPVITISASGANAGYVQLWGRPVWSSDSSYIDSTVTSNVYFWYVHLKMRQHEIYEAQTGSAQPHIYPKHISNLILPKYPLDKIEHFNKQVSSYFELIEENRKNSILLQKTKKELLLNLFVE